MSKIKIIIAGSRTFFNYPVLVKVMKDIFNSKGIKKEDVCIISGGGVGAPSLGELYARRYDLDLKVFEADWNAYGKSAGYRRNEAMAKFASTNAKGYLIAFWHNNSMETKLMIDTAKHYGLESYVFKVNDNGQIINEGESK